MARRGGRLLAVRDWRHGRSWAEIGAFVGQLSVKITADTYTHVIVDGREVDLNRLLLVAIRTS